MRGTQQSVEGTWKLRHKRALFGAMIQDPTCFILVLSLSPFLGSFFSSPLPHIGQVVDSATLIHNSPKRTMSLVQSLLWALTALLTSKLTSSHSLARGEGGGFRQAFLSSLSIPESYNSISITKSKNTKFLQPK